MHEISIAEAMLELARTHVPPEKRLTRVTMRAGPLRQIDPAAMRWAWVAVAGDEIDLTLDLPEDGTDELYLMSIDIDEELSHASSSC